MGFNATIFQLYHGDQFYWWRNPDCIQYIYIYRIGLKGYSTIETNKKRPVWDISTCFFFSMSTRVKVEQQYE